MRHNTQINSKTRAVFISGIRERHNQKGEDPRTFWIISFMYPLDDEIVDKLENLGLNVGHGRYDVEGLVTEKDIARKGLRAMADHGLIRKDTVPIMMLEIKGTPGRGDRMTDDEQFDVPPETNISIDGLRACNALMRARTGNSLDDYILRELFDAIKLTYFWE